jgi:hypothetical protein
MGETTGTGAAVERMEPSAERLPEADTEQLHRIIDARRTQIRGTLRVLEGMERELHDLIQLLRDAV